MLCKVTLGVLKGASKLNVLLLLLLDRKTCWSRWKLGHHEAYGVTGLEPAAPGVSVGPVEHVIVWRVIHQMYHYYNDVLQLSL
jgi:hypothetical protein